MCGLFGILGNGIISTDLRVMEDLKIFSIVRGQDGTGIACGNSQHKRSNVSNVKLNGDALYFDFNLDKREEAVLHNPANNFFIGHTRHATTGGKTYAATQPFHLPNIYGTHNGTVNIDWKNFASDSHALLTYIDNNGVEILRLLDDTKDSYALVWYDTRDHLVHAIRNNQRPFFFAFCKDRPVMYYASESGFLRAAMTRRGVSYESIMYTYPGKEYTFDPSYLKNKKGDPVFDAKDLIPPPPKVEETSTPPWTSDV